jgi:hypothetical protein
MTEKEIIEFIEREKEAYLPDAIESIKLNFHMNDVRKEEIVTGEQVELVLNYFITHLYQAKFVDEMKKSVLLLALTDLSKIIRNGFDNKVDQKVIDVLLVDFINFIGVRQGVDFGLCTKDLES